MTECQPLSQHWKKLVKSKRRTRIPTQVVFLDIEKYSIRSSKNQRRIVDAFTNILDEARHDISRRNRSYEQNYEIDFVKDTLFIPTGDGAAVIFSFEDLHDVHLKFAETVLKLVSQHNKKDGPCLTFITNGWCACHDYFNVNVGISEGESIPYFDINGNPNIAGKVINYAARVLGYCERMHVLFTADGYGTLIDFSDNPLLKSSFVEFKEIEIKHGDKISIWQYRPPHKQGIEKGPSEKLVRAQYLGRIGTSNPRLELQRLTHTQEDRGNNHYRVIRKIKAKALSDQVNEYTQKFRWSGHGDVGDITAGIDQNKYPEYKIRIDDDSTSVRKVCTVTFDSAKKEGDPVEFEYKIDLYDRHSSCRRFLNFTNSDGITEELTLRVRLLKANTDRAYYVRRFLAAGADVPVDARRYILPANSCVIKRRFPKPELHHTYQITW